MNLRILPAAIGLLIAMPASAERLELKNPAWKEVPNTQFDGTAYVNVNGIHKAGSNVIYEVVNAEAAYSQVEMNCKTQRFRTVKMGYFESRSRINYKVVNDPWIKPETAYHKALAAFVCRLK
ncbi:hypothetical protein [Leptolyngbya sp. FACHB-17]|uniref:hypothetical protein n=1 Tax=unclassified Leptolyngbya TaxID=2650499 RepID=UPI001680F5DF|nr:hypothetical protein [Leptolyngbya sp. FACHB-17]MBD2082720.1 hypothetical protein [Leptolyngbya sp. FACHB-17]